MEPREFTPLLFGSACLCKAGIDTIFKSLKNGKTCPLSFIRTVVSEREFKNMDYRDEDSLLICSNYRFNTIQEVKKGGFAG